MWRKWTWVIGMLLAGAALANEPASIWVEGEDATHKEVAGHVWYDSVNTGELSGGRWLSHYSEKGPGGAMFEVRAPQAGTYFLYVRLNPMQGGMQYRVNGGEWVSLTELMNAPIDSRNIAFDGARDMRFIAWVDAGRVELREGVNRVAFSFDGKVKHHGAIDAFVFTQDGRWSPQGTDRPGDARPKFDAPEGKWAFDPGRDRFADDALLDLSHLNESVAGEHGFIGVDERGDFVRGDGEPIRFWAVNTVTYRQGPDAVAENARFLAKHGVNMVRWHGMIQPKRTDQPLDTVDEQALDELFVLVAEMKRRGIYLTISPYYAHSIKLWKDGGDALRRQWGLPRDPKAGDPNGLLFFDAKMQSAYKAWLRELFTRPNPYTGVPLKDEPAVAIFQIQNEDSLLFWTFDKIKGLDRDILRRQYAEWLTEKYGSLDAAQVAWRGAKPAGSDVPDDWNKGLISFCGLWQMFQADGNTGGAGVRMSDQAQFLTETMRDWNAEVERYLREDLGVKQVINAGNWRTADPLRLNDLERYSYTTNQVLGINRYTSGWHEGREHGWAVMAGDRYGSISVTRVPGAFCVALKQVPDKAMILPEALWVPPNFYESEGPFLTAAYQSLNGVDITYWFSMAQAQWRAPSSPNGYLDALGKWVLATPQVMGNFPAAALIFRQNLVERGEPVVVEHRALDDLWHRTPPIISEEGGYDPNRDDGYITDRSPVRTAVDRRAFLVGPVHVVYDSDPAKTRVVDLSPYLKGDVTLSNTGQLEWDQKQGVVTLDAPAAQGATGFLNERGRIELGDVTIDCDNDYATVVVVAMDGQPIATSGKLLVQVGTTCRSNGWKEGPEDRRGLREILSHGKPPWLVDDGKVTLTIANTTVTRATALDPNGYAAGDVAIERSDNGIVLRVPSDAMHVLLQ